MTEKASEADETELRLSLGPPSKPLSLSTATEQQTEIKAASPSSDKLQYNNNGLSLGTLSFPFTKPQQQESSAAGGLSSTALMGSTSSSIRQIMQSVGAAVAPSKPGFTPSKRNYSDAIVNPSARPQPLDQSTNLNCSASVNNVIGRNQHQHQHQHHHHHHHQQQQQQPQLLHQALRWFPADSGMNPVANTNPPHLPNPMTVLQQQQKQPIMNANKPQPSNPSPNDSCHPNSDNPRPVVGWPPVRSFRRNSLAVNNSKPKSGEETEVPSLDTSADVECSSMYVKANMDGVPIGRKLDLKLYNGYPSLKQALGEMFQRSIDEYVLTHEDKDGDWMLVGDVPWDMFLTTVRRLRLMKSSELGTTPLVLMGDNRCPRPRAC